MLLETQGLNLRYGRNHAVRDVDITVDGGEIVTVLGANGAGKSSLLKTIAGAEKSASGSILFNGNDITGWTAPHRVREGLVLVPEGRQILISLTVHENLLMGAYCRNDNEIERDCDAIYERFPNLRDRRNMFASVLSGGEQQMLAIGRGMLARPKLMMLDEPSLGLSPILVNQLFALITDLNNDGLTILLVEQNTHMALKAANRGYVLELGKVVIDGSADELLKSELEKAYLGSA
ncbi:MAG: ABC transporter ATP-binding protein [Rhodospirillales bacterium]|nr:ABC transporter ATP-binding protein [Rhodospirillales bacterium]